MGRRSILDSEAFGRLKGELDAAAQNLEAEKASAKIHLENLARKMDAKKARAIVAAKDAGLSDYAIGLASGHTSHNSRRALIQWAFDLEAGNA